MVLRCHRLLKESFGSNKHFHQMAGLAITPLEFETSLIDFKRAFEFVSMQSAINKIRSGRTLEKSFAVLTFDEGYEKTIELALPILRAHKVPACVFTTTKHFNRKNLLWNDVVSNFVQAHTPSTIRLPWMDKALYTDTEKHVTVSIQRMIRHLTWCDESRRQKLLRGLKIPATPSQKKDALIGLSVIKKHASEPLLSYASHGYNHAPLATLKDVDQKIEIAHSRAILSKLAGRQFVNVFSYPFGYPDSLNESVINRVQKGGYDAAFTSQRGIIRPGDSLFHLPRIRMLPKGRGIAPYEHLGISQAIDELMLVLLGAEERLPRY